jgi:hypothetical protein
MSPDFPKKKKIEVHEIFNQDEDENDALGSGRKRKLVPLGKCIFRRSMNMKKKTINCNF